MYKKCAYCSRLGEDCEGFNLISLNSVDLMDFCRLRKKHLGWSNAELAKRSGVPKGTVDRLFSGHHPDYKYETIRQLVRAFVGNDFYLGYCPEEENTDESKHHIIKIEHQQETIERLEEDKNSLQDDRSTMWKYLDEKSEDNRRRFEFLKKQIEVRNRAIICLVIAVIILLLVIIFK